MKNDGLPILFPVSVGAMRIFMKRLALRAVAGSYGNPAQCQGAFLALLLFSALRQPWALGQPPQLQMAVALERAF
jgi:hypothetical protein